MHKLTFLVTFGLLAVFSFQSKAQDVEFHHGAGIQYDYLTDGMFWVSVPAISYHPRVALELDRDLSLSFGAPLGLGFSFSTYGDSYLVYSVPATVDLNIGFASLERSRADFGGFLGGGYGIYGLGGSGTYHGIYGHLGARFIINDIPISASLFTYQTMDEVQVYGLRAIYELTDF